MSSIKPTDHNKIRSTIRRDQVIKPNIVVSDTNAYVIDMQALLRDLQSAKSRYVLKMITPKNQIQQSTKIEDSYC